MVTRLPLEQKFLVRVQAPQHSFAKASELLCKKRCSDTPLRHRQILALL